MLSIMAKQEDIWLLIDNCDPDITVCMETWLTSTITDIEVLPPGYPIGIIERMVTVVF